MSGGATAAHKSVRFDAGASGSAGPAAGGAGAPAGAGGRPKGGLGAGPAPGAQIHFMTKSHVGSSSVVSAALRAKTIAAIEFGMLTADQQTRMSVMKVTSPSLYEGATHTPTVQGVLDTRLGTSSKKLSCGTCGLSLQECAGHFGHVPLALPVFHIGFLKATVDVLQVRAPRRVRGWGSGGCVGAARQHLRGAATGGSPHRHSHPPPPPRAVAAQSICKTCSRVLLDEEARAAMMRVIRHATTDALKRVSGLPRRDVEGVGGAAVGVRRPQLVLSPSSKPVALTRALAVTAVAASLSAGRGCAAAHSRIVCVHRSPLHVRPCRLAP
jgi:hypothetical protein